MTFKTTETNSAIGSTFLKTSVKVEKFMRTFLFQGFRCTSIYLNSLIRYSYLANFGFLKKIMATLIVPTNYIPDRLKYPGNRLTKGAKFDYATANAENLSWQHASLKIGTCPILLIQ